MNKNKKLLLSTIAAFCITVVLAPAAKGETVGEAIDATRDAAKGRDKDCVRECKKEFSTARECGGGPNPVECTVYTLHSQKDCIDECPSSDN